MSPESFRAVWRSPLALFLITMRLKTCTWSWRANPPPRPRGSAGSAAGICPGDRQSVNNVSRSFAAVGLVLKASVHTSVAPNPGDIWPGPYRKGTLGTCTWLLHTPTVTHRLWCILRRSAFCRSTSVPCNINCTFVGFVILGPGSILQQLNAVEVPLLVHIYIPFLKGFHGH